MLLRTKGRAGDLLHFRIVVATRDILVYRIIAGTGNLLPFRTLASD